ncbi:Beta-1,3-glucosyltransferase [hydrothermal vent metagenome]|uniref:Beta-1,3-glucosyltransferase n=1 Tax=hydrothermal vent metagenome TaxID=652676 RepID=A0A3B0W036_9ZZZZ
MMNYKISIIIPIYNVEEYIEECLNSIFLQLHDFVEIIVINDGTPDNSVAIIKSKFHEWLEKDQVVLINQENLGPGAARNTGVAVARGQYLGFLDSDDVLLPNFFKEVIKSIDEKKTDIIEFGYTRFSSIDDIGSKTFCPLLPFEGQYNLAKIRNDIFAVGAWFPWIRVYKSEIFNKHKFPVNLFYEDLLTIPFIFLMDLKIDFIKQPLVGYRFNPNSTTALHDKSHALTMSDFYYSLDKAEESIAIQILKIKTARSIAYFYNELSDADIPILEVLRNINKIPKKLELLIHLKLPDLVFFLTPKLYMVLDKIRLRKRDSLQ